jgi:RNA polymerase sigma-70 factor (ECF subfamily)
VSGIIHEQFLQLIKDHGGMLHKICGLYAHTHDEREDLFQEIIIQLWKSYPKFRGESKFSTWMYRIALNTSISDLRKRKHRFSTIEPDHIPEQIDDQYNDGKEEQLHQLNQAIDQLNAVEKAIIMLFLEDKTYEEMEEILGINQGNLRVKMNRIKDKLRKLTKAVEYGA